MIAQLTTREAEVIELLSVGEPNKVIARRLGIAESTVEATVARVCRKLNAKNRTAAACAYVRSQCMARQ